MSFTRKEITVIGAGFIGLVSALRLLEDGHQVTLIDREGPGNGASSGNAGVLVQNNAEPISDPNTLLQVPKWLLNPAGPLTLRWKHLPAIFPWLGRMVMESHPDRFNANASALQQLTQHAVPEWNKLVKDTRSEELIKPLGWFKVYKSEKAWASGQKIIYSCEKHGTKYEILNQDEIRQLEPHLAPVFKHGILQPDSSFICSPQKMLDQLFERFLSKGGKFQKAKINAIQPTSNTTNLLLEDGSLIKCNEVLLAAGGWSNKLLKTFGQSVHLQVERGYHAMIKHAEIGPLIGRPTMFVDHMFVMAPMLEGMRLTCQVELAEIDSPPDYTRLRRLTQKAKEVIPGLTMEIEQEWMGARPSQPDSIPTIGRLPNHPNIMLAFGHQHLGVTMAAITGRIISDLFANRDPQIDLTPYRAIR